MKVLVLVALFFASSSFAAQVCQVDSEKMYVESYPSSKECFLIKYESLYLDEGVEDIGIHSMVACLDSEKNKSLSDVSVEAILKVVDKNIFEVSIDEEYSDYGVLSAKFSCQ